MSDPVLCPSCLMPYPFGKRCRGCERPKALAPPVPRLGPWTAGAVLLVALAGCGTREPPTAAEVSPEPTSELVARTREQLSPPSKTPSPADSSPPMASTQAEEEAALSVLSLVVSSYLQAPQLPSALVPAPDRRPETAPAVAPMLPVPEPTPHRPSGRVPEDSLRKELAAVPEFGLSPGARQALVQAYAAQYRSNTTIRMAIRFDPFTLLQHYPQAAELPIRSAANCQLGPDAARTLGVLARKLHAYLDLVAPKDADGKRKEPTQLREVLTRERRGNRPEWLRAEAVPALMQILMAEDVPLRLMLVDMLYEIDGKAATVALARRAVFDLSPRVRREARDALRERPPAEARPTLVDALRYPWAPVAEHAAEALVALVDRDAVPLLVAQLGKPDPALPFSTGKSGAAVRELVRVHHQANCLLCHAPAVDRKDPVVGVDPAVTLVTGGGGGKGKGWGGGRPGPTPMWVRADVQFLRQDFSVTLPAGQPNGDGQRFDFLVRTRPLRASELRERKQQPRPGPETYPQREATLFALRTLTGKDVGPTTEAWVQLFPHANAEPIP